MEKNEKLMNVVQIFIKENDDDETNWKMIFETNYFY